MPGRIVRGLPVARFASADDMRLSLAYLTEQERLHCIRPEWRFAWVGDDGDVGARVVYWGLPNEDRPMLVDHVVADAAGTVGAVLAASLAELAIGEIDYAPDRPIGGGRSLRTEPPELEASGFAPVAVQVRLAHASETVVASRLPTNIELTPATDDVLRMLIAAVAEGSSDRGSRDRDPAVELAATRRLDHDPAGWEVAVDRGSGEPLGFVLPARTGDGEHVIAFIGVVPAARGRGLGRTLLARGTAALRRDAPHGRIIADVDETNIGMLRAAAAVGYAAFATRAHYRRGSSE